MSLEEVKELRVRQGGREIPEQWDSYESGNLINLIWLANSSVRD